MQDRSQNSAEQESIVEGPEKFELFARFGLRETVTFEVKRSSRVRGSASTTGRTSVVVTINKLEFEDGSGHNWLFSGFVPGTGQDVEGYYSTRRNTGWLKRTTR